MYHYSRAIFRALKDMVEPQNDSVTPGEARRQVLEACERTVQRLAEDPRYFARPARTLFNDIRAYFPMSAQPRILRVIDQYLGFADEFLRAQPHNGFDLYGNPLQCRASTRKGTPCQRMPLPHNGYCPSHQHLAETEEIPALAA